jgi:VanZ family protein
MKKIINYLQVNKRQSLTLAVFWTVLIFIGCSRPGKDLPKLNLFDNFDKVVHFTFFFLFFFFWFFVSNKSTLQRSFLILFISFLYGLGIEYYQKYCVSGRSFDVWDVLADTLGALVCYLLVSKSVFINKSNI